ncbi:MAG TPA: Gfo/Idh/MocA family oxidoreductase [Bryobacteraceae bacterium]|nr:Gfo/Idh/MocA family oxidoreductase [Bryobacteraceae bacterium]
MDLNRRHLLAGTAAAAAQSALLGQPKTARIPTAMIGVGNRGSHVLKGVIEQPNAAVAALCDIKPDRLDAAATAAATDKPATYKDWRAIIDRKDIEVVFIATPPHLHAEMAVAALQAGKHVYCEKPIGVTPEQVRDVVKAARNSKKVFIAGQQMRSFTQIQEAVAQIRAGVIGNVLMVKAQRHAGSDLNHEGTSADWYFDASKSGGYLIEQSVHNLDACNWALGEHPIRASGFGGTLLYKNDPPRRDIFDCNVLSYDYPSGAKLSFTLNVFHPSGMPSGGQYIHLFGSKGAVDLLYSTNMYKLGSKDPAVVLAATRQEAPHGHTAAFYDCITKNGKNPADITVGASAALTAIMGHMAMTNQSVISWDELGVVL